MIVGDFLYCMNLHVSFGADNGLIIYGLIYNINIMVIRLHIKFPNEFFVSICSIFSVFTNAIGLLLMFVIVITLVVFYNYHFFECLFRLSYFLPFRLSRIGSSNLFSCCFFIMPSALF